MRRAWYRQHSHVIAGVDEVGRGCLAGPVVAASVVLDASRPISGLNDSKKLSASQRNELFEIIRTQALAVGVAQVKSEYIDNINILRAAQIAMARAVMKAQRSHFGPLMQVLVDGNQRIPLLDNIEQHTIIGGDALWEPIMAASIIAKVFRDRLMEKAAVRYPGYGFERNKGYGTALHIDGLVRLGPCKIHRFTFAPVREASTRELGSAF